MTTKLIRIMIGLKLLLPRTRLRGLSYSKLLIQGGGHTVMSICIIVEFMRDIKSRISVTSMFSSNLSR